jgi:hypothetical protein
MDRDRFATGTKTSTELTHINVPSTMDPRYSNSGYGITPKVKKGYRRLNSSYQSKTGTIS